MIMNMIAGGKTPTGTRNITANGTYDVTDYASANVNVPDTVDRPVLLWTNPNPDNEFRAQTVSLNGSPYSAYIVEFQKVADTDGIKILLNMGTTDYAFNSNGWGRTINSVTTTGISFSDDSAAYASYNVPTRIWGVKFTL